MPEIHPSILTADFLKLGEVIEMLNRSEAEMIHLDVMDGNFVSNLSFGLPVIKKIHSVAKKPLDTHLMITNADQYIEAYHEAGAASLTVHMEACPHLHRTVSRIRELGMKTAVSLNPHTPVNSLAEILSELDMVLIMTVNPGFGGQKFIPHSYEKIRKLKKMIDDRGLSVKIQVDGGVGLQNIGALMEAGAEVFVVGNTVFSSPDPEEMIRKLKNSSPGQ